MYVELRCFSIFPISMCSLFGVRWQCFFLFSFLSFSCWVFVYASRHFAINTIVIMIIIIAVVDYLLAVPRLCWTKVFAVNAWRSRSKPTHTHTHTLPSQPQPQPQPQPFALYLSSSFVVVVFSFSLYFSHVAIICYPTQSASQPVLPAFIRIKTEKCLSVLCSAATTTTTTAAATRKDEKKKRVVASYRVSHGSVATVASHSSQYCKIRSCIISNVIGRMVKCVCNSDCAHKMFTLWKYLRQWVAGIERGMGDVSGCRRAKKRRKKVE